MKNVLITGMSAGLGKALAEKYSETGYTVSGLSRSEVKGYNHIECDLIWKHQIPEKLRTLLKDVSEIDVVILNAGVLGQIEFSNKVVLPELERVLDINTLSNKMIIDYLINKKIEVKQVVAISSGAAINTYTGWGNYSISKAALNMMMKVYAIENPKTHFLSLSPGPVNTSMQDFICEEVDGEKFEWKKKFVELRENNEAPSADEAAEKIYELLPQLKEELESGSFIDVREL
jgi:NAD(P)-dependent dehydrogenase (short-subunit alcohol dehydrogenase family)